MKSVGLNLNFDPSLHLHPYFCMQAENNLLSLPTGTGSSESILLADVISTKTLCADNYSHWVIATYEGLNGVISKIKAW